MMSITSRDGNLTQPGVKDPQRIVLRMDILKLGGWPQPLKEDERGDLFLKNSKMRRNPSYNWKGAEGEVGRVRRLPKD